ncbi:MAG: TetR family transcriptional regulator [Actinomycetes bacterium]
MTIAQAATELSARDSILRDRILSAAATLTAEGGWSTVTMARLADRVGVSRQTIYNEVGSKPALAESLVRRELARFLAIVNESFDRHPGDAVEAIRAATLGVLELARRDPLVGAVVAGSYGADSDLLPLLTTRSRALVESVTAAIASYVEQYDVPIAHDRRDAAIDGIVRIVLSHIIQPGTDPTAVADDVAWISGRILAEPDPTAVSPSHRHV